MKQDFSSSKAVFTARAERSLSKVHFTFSLPSFPYSPDSNASVNKTSLCFCYCIIYSTSSATTFFPSYRNFRRSPIKISRYFNTLLIRLQSSFLNAILLYTCYLKVRINIVNFSISEDGKVKRQGHKRQKLHIYLHKSTSVVFNMPLHTVKLFYATRKITSKPTCDFKHITT